MPNRLSKSSSPYLLQHQHNPVDWYPWGEDAFAAARERDVPIFLSVGYSTCYWCHVMERECFENPDIAQIMNDRFVSIKVDREERPDVDDLYMAAVQAFTQRGGWPMSVFLEPRTLKPFWAGTYFPPRSDPRLGDIPAFPQILTALSEAWKNQRNDILTQADDLAEAVRERTAESAPPAAIGEPQITQAIAQLLKLHDNVHGGFGPAPKFPQPAFLDLLLSTRAAAGDDDTRAAIDHALRTTLTAMASGGIFDQIGGGFHRYSVDAQWIVPHFEKMLYDNGALAAIYAEAAHLYGDPLFARTARRTCDYILREMTAPDGAFFSAQDAEVNHREGRNYLWTRSQLVETLGEQDAEWIAQIYGISPDGSGNFRDPHHPHDPPGNVLRIIGLPPDGSASDPATIFADPALTARLDALNAKLYTARAQRDQPSTDTKVIAGWNGLMIRGLARAGVLLNEPKYLHAARRAADFFLYRMRGGEGNLSRIFARSRASVPAYLEDYALLAEGLLALHAAAPKESADYLTAAVELAERALYHFADNTGALYDTPADQPDLFLRTRSTYDGAMPSGTSVMLHVFLDLALATRDRTHALAAAKSLVAISGQLAQSPLAAANSARALLRLLAIDRAALSAALADAGATQPAPSPAAHADDRTPVEILSAVEEVTIPPAEPVGFILKVRIAPGYHVNAAVPNDPALIPFKVHIVHGSGIAVYADYPEGTLLNASGGGQAEAPELINPRVYTGELDLPIVLERTGSWTGTPLLAVTYQACTDTECLPPRTVELDLEVNKG